jgi:mitochondrial distribution and morphology protein 12
MSVNIDWETITGGPDGQKLADQVRDFMHERFQQISLPRFLKAVHVHSFTFGSACPEVEIKDICDPLPDFYDEDDSDEAGDENSAQP